MLWEVEVHQKLHDPELERARQEYDLLTQTARGGDLVRRFARGYLFEGTLDRAQLDRLLDELLVDHVTEFALAGPLNQLSEETPQHDSSPGADGRERNGGGRAVTVLPRPGVMDPVAQSVAEEAHELGIPVESVSTFRRYFLNPAALAEADRDVLFRKVLANEAIEQVVEGALSLDHLGVGTPYTFRLVTVPLRERDDASLERLSREGQLSLSLAEMRAVQEHFRALGRDPTDAELETLAQTWSEHCSHKTLKGQIDFDGRRIDNLLRETIFGATQEIRLRLGPDDWCVSVFEDNAGVVRFDERYHVCFKVETHNHPSAIEPYGGANTGLGGVIRDPLGTGLGARPVCNTDVFCFAPPDTPPDSLPPGVLHPTKIIRGVVAGVRDYGNRIGIPTVNGAVCFDPRYLANPLVFCGTVGLIPVDRCHKQPEAGDLIVVVGGRTGRDGIHGATFSSVELTPESEKVSGGAVQIGNAITEKKLLDVLLQARDRGLYHAITDCGAGGFSSAVGEMGERLGAVVHLERAPLKYEGLSYTEIWISEAQERMILAVPPGRWPILKALCASEHVEATVIGNFEATGRLRLFYAGHPVADLDMAFLHHGRPPVVRKATWPERESGGVVSGEWSNASPRTTDHGGLTPRRSPLTNFTDDLLRILSTYDVCSKEWVIRQYDHEVQGGTVIKPLVGVRADGPGDAAVVAPVLGSPIGLAVGCGINVHYGDLDPYAMAAAVIDEAVRNVIAVGADPARVALLDNFCWGNTDRPEVLGGLVRAAEACRDVAVAYGMPFISGKDSLNNEYHAGGRHITIPPTLLISALGRVPDVRRCVTMDLKEAGNHLLLVGATRNEMGGSQLHLLKGLRGGAPPRVDLELAPLIFRTLHGAITKGLVRSCHDLSDGGLAVAVAEMAFAGGVGADVTALPGSGSLPDEVSLFAESTTRFLLEVRPDQVDALRATLGDAVPLARIGRTTSEPRLRIAGAAGEWVVWATLDALKEAWQRPLRW
jgi:phosphoribosylformylglycinamidine synthase